MTRTMYDSVTAARIPANATMVACYIDGHYANETEIRRRFPHATIVRITPHGKPGADVVDCEQGDLTPPQAAAWAKAEVDAGRHPTIYCSASAWDTCIHEVNTLGIGAHVSWWIAHYGQPPVVPHGAVAIQYRNDVGANLDYSAVVDYWPGVDPKPAPPVAPKQVAALQPNPYAHYAAVCEQGAKGKQVLYVTWALDHEHQRDLFDARLTATVAAWQKANPQCGRVDGKVGPKTLAALHAVKHH